MELLQLLRSVISKADDVVDVAEKQLRLQWVRTSLLLPLCQADGERSAVGAGVAGSFGHEKRRRRS